MGLLDGSRLVKRYVVSTAKNGVGNERGSYKTPLGRHMVRAKIGEDCPVNTVFVARRSTGEIYAPELAREFLQRDWVLTRILWLSGLEAGKNRLGHVDSMQRYIYIHGCPDVYPMGVPLSHGCIRMRNLDIIELFDLVDVGVEVFIEE